MFTITIQADTPAGLNAKVADLYNATFGQVVEAAPTPPPAEKPKVEKPKAEKADPPAQAATPAASPSTPAPQKADDPALSDDEFPPYGIKWAASFQDKGATAKTLLAEFGAERFSAIPPERRREALDRMAEITEQAALA